MLKRDHGLWMRVKSKKALEKERTLMFMDQ